MPNLKKLTPVAWTQVDVDDAFWNPRIHANRTVTLPLEYALNKKNGVLDAYQWDWWDLAKSKPPWHIWVGDLGKWIEAASYSLAKHPDAAVATQMDDVISRIIKGQKEDGYIYPNPLPKSWRWANLVSWHEFYEVGHDIEGAVAHYQATGQRHFLDAVCRCADLMEANFGTEPGKKRGYDGHPEIELAMMKLYRATGEPRYLKLAKFFVDERRREPNYFALEAQAATRAGVPLTTWDGKPGDYHYYQAHKPLRQQEQAVGHAVRALYLYSGAVDVAVETGDGELLATCRRLWKNLTRRRMYVIGGVGSSQHGEAFTFDYDLPNETAYAETCANIALVFLAHRLLQVDADGEYADVMERAIYNGVLSGISLDGRRFFYANHLAAFPASGSDKFDAVATSRREWFGCACCPPNIARLIASIGQYAYSTSATGLYVHLYMGGSVHAQIAGQTVTVRQQTQYPWKETVRLSVDPQTPATFDLLLRIPGWCRRATLKVNGKAVALKNITRKSYARIHRQWSQGDQVELTLSMLVQRIEANPNVRMDCGKVALQRGPVVYCLEEIDNGKNLADLALPRQAKLSAAFDKKLSATVITAKALRRQPAGWGDTLYRPAQSATHPAALRAVPYCLWNNRGDGEMLVWIRQP